MDSFLPSKRFMLVIALIILTGGVIYLLSSFRGSHSLSYQEPLTVLATSSESIRREIEEEDADNDGLKDWEEILWKTNSTNPDSDNDGTPDGEEVALNRHPLVTGPSDTITSTTFSEDTIYTPNFETNLTDKLAREVVATYLNAKTLEEGELSDSSKQAILDTVLTNAGYSFESESYTTSELEHVPATKENATLYGREMGSIILEYSNNIDGISLADEIQRVVSTGNVTNIENITIFAQALRTLSQESLQINVPTDFASSHVEFINNLSSLATAIENISYTYEDPLRTVGAFEVFNETLDALSLQFGEIKAYFEKKGILYEEGDTGYYYTTLE